MGLGDKVVLASDPDEEEEEEELVDPQDTMKENCSEKSECDSSKALLEACNSRVGGSSTEETCEERAL